jgi:glycosyltransferase involved in cell wall biosynthesis
MEVKIVAVIPAKNEARTIDRVVEHARKYCNRVFVFDDGSTDLTKCVKGADAVISNPCNINLGKGTTLRSAILWLFWNKILREDDVVIFLDSDGQHNPESIPDLIEFIKDNDMVIGIRTNLNQYPLTKQIGNYLLSKWCSLLSGLNIKDSESGYRIIRTPLLREILKYSSSRRYGIEIEINIIAGQLGYDVFQLPIRSDYIKKNGVTVKHGILNAINGLLCWIKLRLL